MSPQFPYTYISCPCSDSTRQIKPISFRGTRESVSTVDEEDDEDERTFDPKHPRANYSLFPPEHLLYCEECHDIKCPRCITEEIVCWYCPSCLFETPSSMVRSEGNRCARNCFNCPICTSSLIVMSIGDGAVNTGPWILSCNYCMWTSLDVGIKFDKPTNIRSQLDKIANPGLSKSISPDMSRKSSSLSREPKEETSAEEETTDSTSASGPIDPVARFAALKSFYKQQLVSSTGADATSAYGDYSSPSALTRIMNLYTSGGAAALRKPKTKTPIMREALTSSEGFQVGYTPSTSSVQSTNPCSDLYDTPTPDQLFNQYPVTAGGNPSSKSNSSLRPMPTLLRTKRSKRCKDCKHILVKPEFKPQSTRFRIRLVALAYVPLINLRPLRPPTPSSTSSTAEGMILKPGKPTQFILTLKNHLFDPVKVSLGVPATVPGKYPHKVTVLCPQFEIGANTDVWDDALANTTNTTSGSTATTSTGSTEKSGGPGTGTMEAGKVYERGRNWVGVGVEVVCAPIVDFPAPAPAPAQTTTTPINPDTDHHQQQPPNADPDPDPEILEIPIRVRLEWRQSDAAADDHHREDTAKSGGGSAAGGGRGEKKNGTGDEEDDPAKRELAYWMVVGVGRVGDKL